MVGWFGSTSQFTTVVAGKPTIDRGGMAVIDPMIHGPDHGHSVHPCCHSGQPIAKANTGKRSGNSFEFATNFGGGVWLGVPHIQMAGASVKEDQDAGIRFGGDGIIGGNIPGTKQAR